MTAAPDILCIGEAMVEFVREDGGARFRQGFGGDTSNAVIAAARQGARTGYVTALGTDRFGDALMAHWVVEGVDTTLVRRDPAAPTGIYFIEPDPAERHFTYYRAGSAASCLRPADLDLTALGRARVLHLSGITLGVSAGLRACATAAADAVRAAGGTVSLDTNLREKLWPLDVAREATHAAASRAQIVFTSIDDCARLTGLTAPADIASFYRNLGVRIVLVTLGAGGCFLAEGDTCTPIPPAPATPVDSTGAGDSFAGAFLAWWCETGDAVLAAGRAAIVAAGTVSGLGAVASIPRRDQVLAAGRAGA